MGTSPLNCIRSWASSLLVTFAGVAIASTAFAQDLPPLITIEAHSDGANADASIRRGFGFVMETDGFLLSSYQNLTDPETGALLPEIRVVIWDQRDRGSVPARVIGVEPTLNLAVLKVEAKTPLRAAELDKQRLAEVGKQIFAATRLDPEHPTELNVVRGNLTGLNDKECYQASLTSTMFQAHMKLSPTLIGAPIYGIDGKIVALYTAYAGEVSIGEPEDEVHVLPIFLATNIYDSIKRKRSYESPWTGFSVRSLTPAETKASFPTSRGYRSGIAIEYVWENSPAERMGIRVGDVLLRLGGARTSNVGSFQKWLYLYGVGHRAQLTFLRDGKEHLVVDYVIEKRPDWARPK